MRDICILPKAIFKNVVDAYNFFIISNLFDSYKPYTFLSTRMCEQNASYVAKHLNLGSKSLNTICLKIFKKH